MAEGPQTHGSQTYKVINASFHETETINKKAGQVTGFFLKAT
jgi:hypothetical protein